MGMFTVRDTKGRESRTLFFVAASWLLVSGRFLLSMWPPVGLPMTANEYAMAVTMILGIWLGREWIKSED